MDHAGDVTALDVAENYNRIPLLPQAHTLRFALVDLRRITQLRAYFDGLGAVADMIASDAEARPVPWDIAFVSDNTGHYPLLLDYVGRMRRSGAVRCDLFPDMEKAVGWLGVDRALVQRLDRLHLQTTPR